MPPQKGTELRGDAAASRALRVLLSHRVTLSVTLLHHCVSSTRVLVWASRGGRRYSQGSLSIPTAHSTHPKEYTSEGGPQTLRTEQWMSGDDPSGEFIREAVREK